MAKAKPYSVLYIVLLSSLLLNFACLLFVGKRYLSRVATKPNTSVAKLPYYMARDKLFEAMPFDTGAVVFLGNSLTQYYELSEFFPGFKIKNRGIHGDMMEKVMQRLSPIIASKPKKIFIELGVNDIEQQVPTETLLAMYSRLLDTLKTTCPFTTIYVQSLLPVADTSFYLPVSYCSPEINRKIVVMNSELRRLAVSKVCPFIDVYSAMVKGGQLNALYSADGVHLSGNGYVVWTKLLMPYVTQ